MSWDIKLLELEGRCCDINIEQWNAWMDGAIELTDKEQLLVNRLVLRDMPELYKELGLYLRNPYTYSKTSRHIVLVWSCIEYFITYKADAD